MIPSGGQYQLLSQLSQSWPSSQRLVLPAPGQPLRVAGHSLAGEIEALLRSEAASLPFCRRDGVLWLSIAPTAEALQALVGDLRAWVIPSYGWEDPSHPFVAPGEARGTLAETVTLLSPAGYFRWRSTTGQLAAVEAKLREMRQLAALRPADARERVPSLLELRQQFALGLLTGDRDAADAAVRAIDHHQLDSAINTQLMRVRLRDRFREYEALVADPLLETLIQARMPQAVRVAIVRAFYTVLLEPLEQVGELQRAIEAYSGRAHPLIGGLLEFCRPADGPEVLRALGYRARHRRDAAAARALLEVEGGEVLRPLLAPLLEAEERPAPEPPATAALPAPPLSLPVVPPSLAAEWHDALSRGDVRRVQEVGLALLLGDASGLPTFVRAGLPAVLRETLEEVPNEALRQALDEIARLPGDVGDTRQPTLPQSWPDFLERVRRRDWDAVLRFLRSAERPVLDSMGVADFDAVVETLEELLTDPTLRTDPRGVRVLAEGLPVFVEEFVSEPQFPRPGLTPLYTQLLRLWAEVRRGSTSAPDGQVLLVLASAVLQQPERDEDEVAALLRGWWDARPSPTLLPYLIEAVELLAEQLANQEAAQGLWIAGAEVVRREVAELSPGERALWRRLGTRIDIDRPFVEECLGPDPTGAGGQRDPIAEAGLRKVAIVSLHEKPAVEAKAMIEERTDAHVIVVAELAAGAGTRSATTADVILYVWSASKHAVYRAFDGVRDRVVPVTGTGAGSIVLALERWAAARLRLAAS